MARAFTNSLCMILRNTLLEADIGPEYNGQIVFLLHNKLFAFCSQTIRGARKASLYHINALIPHLIKAQHPHKLATEYIFGIWTLTMSELRNFLDRFRESGVTKVHRELYPAIDPSSPALSQVGKTVLIPGGGTGVGYEVARSFVKASADTVIIVGRRRAVLQSSAAKLEQEARTIGSTSRIIARTCDVVNLADVDTLWDYLDEQGIYVDVLVNNVAKFSEPKSIFGLGTAEVWSQMEVNVKSPLFLAERFYGQSSKLGCQRKFLINTSSAAVHTVSSIGDTQRPAYVLSKMAGTLLCQVLAEDIAATEMQIISFHPGMIYNDEWKAMNIPQEFLDSGEVCGGFVVWAATERAEFLHGRFIWASWDIDELATGGSGSVLMKSPLFSNAQS
ncbi:hypothetical protein FPRO04_11566 [Fusarium proliferatum]|nr:hypothetical protein FPRO04_11566 [Fusarium proliferatum]